MAGISRSSRILIGQINKQFGKKRVRLSKKDKFINSFNHNNRKLYEQQKLTHEINFNTGIEIMPKYLKSYGKELFGTNFNEKKNLLIQLAAKHKDKSLMSLVSKSKTPEELYEACLKYNQSLFINGNKEGERLLQLTKGKFTLDLEKELVKIRENRNTKMMRLYKALETPSKNPEVIKIEKELVEKFGMKSANFHDDLDKAKEMLEIAHTLRLKGKTLPDNVFVSNLHPSAGEIIQLNGQKTIIVQSSKLGEKMDTANCSIDYLKELVSTVGEAKFDKYTSYVANLLEKGIGMYASNSPKHILTHECMHAEHPMLGAFSLRKLPAKYKPIVENISLYTNLNGNRAEILTELNTKRTITGSLPPQEEELFNFVRWI